MIRHSPRQRAAAISLAGLAGFVDAIAFLALGGYFVSFMSGNTTRLGADMVVDLGGAWLPGLILSLFVGGVVGGSLLGRWVSPHWRRVTILSLVTFLLLIAAILCLWSPLPGLLFVAVAMGAENTVFERDGEVSIGLTYMTGALVKAGQNFAAALCGASHAAWLWYAALWSGLALGAVAGAFVYGRIGLAALWLATGFAAIVTAADIFRTFRRYGAYPHLRR